MSNVNWAEATTITPGELPVAITGYLLAHGRRDTETALASYTTDAVVTDEGHTYRGPAQIRNWLASAASEYTFTTELVGASMVDATHYDVRQHLAGDFPGGTADLHYRFTMRGASIAELVITP
ncbi:nuclear transport factor 2 family protein [Catellatospora citrea]|uniref:nuclear transport factor 2 family protein n=1 Tax=Catellatospora citrea TaxID=53366 RepID=UPI0033F9E1A0